MVFIYISISSICLGNSSSSRAGSYSSTCLFITREEHLLSRTSCIPTRFLLCGRFEFPKAATAISLLLRLLLRGDLALSITSLVRLPLNPGRFLAASPRHAMGAGTMLCDFQGWDIKDRAAPGPCSLEHLRSQLWSRRVVRKSGCVGRPRRGAPFESHRSPASEGSLSRHRAYE